MPLSVAKAVGIPQPSNSYSQSPPNEILKSPDFRGLGFGFFLTSKTATPKNLDIVPIFFKLVAGQEHMVYRATFSAFKNSVETKSRSCNSSSVNPKK